jgi:HK97 family phage portal protein
VRSLIGSVLNRAPIAYTPRRGSFGGFGQGAAPSMTQSLQAMGSVGTLFAIVSRISQATASTQWCLYRTSTDNRRAYATTPRPRQEVTKHPALQVWQKPNPFMSQQQFVETFSQHQELVGEAYWLPAQDDRFSFPVELWPARPDRMAEVPSPTEFLKGWVYSDPDGAKVPLGVDEVIQIKAPNPTNPYRGMGAVQTILTDLDSVRYSAEWNRNFFVNGAQPGGIVEVPGNLTDDEFDEFNDRWRASHQGVAKAHKVALLENNMKWIDVNYSQKDMQFVELRNVGREIIQEAFGISKTMLGMTEDVNRATAEAAEYVFSRWLLTSRLDRIRGALNEQFLPLFGPLGEGLEFDYISPVPADLDREASERTSKVDAVVKLIGEGFDPAEVLAFLGLPDLTHVGRQDAQPVTVGGAEDRSSAG